MKNFTYYAFISYKREDESWAKWLQDKLEYFKLPTANEDDDAEYLRPIFRDVTDLRPGALPERIREALDASKFLVAICSPRYSESPWCDAEVKRFIQTGKVRQIIPFIIDGIPYSDKEECFPPSLKELRGTENEILGANAKDTNREYAFIQVVASMLDVKVDSLWNRYLRTEEEEKRRIKEQNDKLLSLQSKITSERAKDLLEKWPFDKDKAAKLALEVLPKNIDYPERPWTPEAEYVLRNVLKTIMDEKTIVDEGGVISFSKNYIICKGRSGPLPLPPSRPLRLYDNNSQLLKIFNPGVTHAIFSDDEQYLAMVTDNKIIVNDVINQHELFSKSCELNFEIIIKFSHNNRYLACAAGKRIYIIDIVLGKLVELLGHTSKIMSIEFDLQDKKIISSSLDKTVKIWDLDNYEIIIDKTFDTIATCASFVPAENVFIAALSYKENNFSSKCLIKAYSIATQENVWNLNLFGIYAINNMELVKELNILIIENLSNIYLFDLNSGIMICEYVGGELFKYDKNNQEITLINCKSYKKEKNSNTFVNTFAKSTYFIPSKYQLIEDGINKYESYNLTVEDKKQFFLI